MAAQPPSDRAGASAAPEREVPPTLRDVGEALLHVAQRLDGLLTELAAEHGLSAFQARTLRALRDDPSQAALARQLGCTASRVSIVTGELEERGLVRRVPSRSDRRMRVTRLTEEGGRAVEAIGAGLTFRSPLEHALDDRQVEDLFRLLRAVEAVPDR
ncbi:hypothetical protein SUDANB67_02617 [Nocardiopsis dassonvillei]